MSTITPDSPVRPVLLSVEDGIAWIRFDLPGEKVNKLSADVLGAFERVLEELGSRSGIEAAVVTSGKDGMFIAGADVNAIRDIETRDEARDAARRGQAVFRRLSELPFPVVAAIDGVCLGGGTELALACNGRLGTDHPRFQIGLPEINLGILPAWGGTTRLPRQVGLRSALELILTGRSIDARRAERIGLVDRVVPHQHVERHAAELARELGDGPRPARRRRGGLLVWLLEGNPLGRSVVLRQARKRVLARTRGHYPAPLAVLDVLRRGFAASVETSMSLEVEALGDLLVGPVSRNLVHLFFLSESAKKDKGVSGEVGALPELDRAGLLGAGTMGGGIAWLFSYRDIPVRVKDVAPEALGAGMRAARRLHEQRKKRGRVTGWELEKKMSLISPSLDWSGFRSVDVVLEAIVEDLEIKKKVLRELEDVVPEEVLIGTNTSTLPIGELQSALAHPERMAGFHFFNPVEKMPLIEVIRGRQTSDLTVASFVALAKRLGKTPVVVQDGPGFLVNRILGPYLNEACLLLEETGDLEGIDRALLDFGMPMGPLRLLDEIGLDVAQKAGKVLGEAFGERAAPSGVLSKLTSAGRMGKKTDRGFYVHQEKGSRPDPTLPGLLGVSRQRSVDKREAEERCTLVMIAEAIRCLDEGIVRRPADVDLAMVLGTGFPPFRGGVLRHAESVTLGAVLEGLERWRGQKGVRFEPPPGLRERVDTGEGFAWSKSDTGRRSKFPT